MFTKAQTIYSPLYTSANFTKTIDLNRPVGTISGSAGTNGSGGVTYSIPIYTPPGTNGIQPSIAIAYNSQGGSGIAGYGWFISGLSVISRGGKDFFHDGMVTPVEYNYESPFLLDGMRLNTIQGDNGGDGTIYAGESESFARITSYRGNGTLSNPDWFLATTKEGTKMYFGNTNDSRIMAENGYSVMLWRLSMIIDINGNFVEFKYDNTGRDSRIDEINYTGNINTGLQPYNQLKFIYGSRYDNNTGYEAGASLAQNYLLNSITVKHTNDNNIIETVKTYDFNYGYDNVHSLLKEVVESGAGTTASTPLNTTIFLYGDQPQNITVASDGVNGQYGFYAGDFDADGKSDLLTVESYYDNQLGRRIDINYKVWNGANGMAPVYNKTLPPNTSVNLDERKFYNFLSSDYNKDGRDDVLETKVSWSTTHGKRMLDDITINYTTGTGQGYTSANFIYPFTNKYIHQAGNFFIPGDFDGDGNQDYILILGSHVTNLQFDYKSFFTSPALGQTNLEILALGYGIQSAPTNLAEKVAEADMITPIDMDGDGKTEILVTKGSQSYLYRIRPITGNLPYYYEAQLLSTTTEIATGAKVYPGDFNGDRKTDMLVRNANGTWKTVISSGYSFSAYSFTFNQTVIMSGNTNHKIVVSDFNADGKTDILHCISTAEASTSQLYIYYSRGVSNFLNETYTYNNRINSVYNYIVNNRFLAADFNGDGRSDLFNSNDIFNSSDIISIKPDGQERLLQKVTNGHNVTTSFEYKKLTDKSAQPYVYNRTIALNDPANQNPFNYVQLPMYVVSSMIAPDGIGGTSSTSYFYEDAVIHRAGKGFLGFKKLTAKNNTTGITAISETEINAQHAVPYSSKQATLLTATNQLLAESFTVNSFVNLSTGSHDKRYFHKVDKTLSVDHINGTASESNNTYDNYGNITINIAKIGTLSSNTVTPVETTTTNTTFGIHNTLFPAKPDNITVAATRTGMPSVSSTSTYTYTANGLPQSQTSFAGQPKAVTTTYTYNSFGNPTQTVTSASGVSNRTATAAFDTKGRYPLTKSAIGSGIAQTETYTYDGKWGKPLSHKSSDCLTTTFEYDGYGMLKKTNLPEGYAVNNSLVWDVQGQTVFYAFTDFPGGKPDTKTWMDKLGRQVKTQVAGFGGQWLTQLTAYNNKGQVATQTNSYYPAETPLVTTTTYDVYGRAVSAVNSLTSITTTYSNLTGGRVEIITQNGGGQTASKIIDAAGKTVSAIDNGGQLDFTYDSRGNQVETKHGTTIMVTSTYDVYGRQVTLVDKNAGTITYDYDAYGQLKQQTDNIGNSYTMAYDDFGRIISRQGTEGTTTYEYYLQVNGEKGCGTKSNNNLSKVTGFNAVVKEFTYNNLQRLSSEKVTIDGLPYITQYIYDTYGNNTNITYPSGVVVNNVYDANGGLVTVTGGNSMFPTTLFTTNAINGSGQYTSYTLGNGKTSQNTYTQGIPTRFYTPAVQDLNFSWDYAKGNLNSRYDALKNLTETFQYDPLNRLTTATVNGVQQLNINYDGSAAHSMGNITSKTDAGNYVYKNDKIHAVAYITNPAGTTAPPVTISAAEQNITYTPFLKTGSINEGNLWNVDYSYGPDYQRVKSEFRESGMLMETKYYLGNYEKQLTGGFGGGATREVHYVSGGNGICAMIVKENGINTIQYVYTDYLGSLLALTDAGGNVIAEQNFDAWGRFRQPNNWQYGGTGMIGSFFNRGYTGHEHLPQFALINMNGRMYDPIQGRMMSPDNYVPNPLSTQGYNRYSYANNNPLVFTDPDGNFIHIIIGALIGGVVNLVSSAIQGNIDSWGDGFKAFGLGALQGGIGAAIGFGGFGAKGLAAATKAGFLTANSVIGNIAAGIGSSLIPPIPFGDNFSISPSFAFGSHGLSGGLNARFRSGNFSVGVGFSSSSGASSLSYGGGWDDGKFGLSYSHTNFSGSMKQATGTYGFRIGGFSGSWENDLFASGNEDRWRSNGIGFSYGFKNGSSLSIGSRLMTGEDDGTDGVRYPTEYVENSSTIHREGLFYATYTNSRGKSTSWGIDNERWRYGFHRFLFIVLQRMVFLAIFILHTLAEDLLGMATITPILIFGSL